MEKNDITTKVLIGLVSLMLVAVIVLGYLLYKTSKEKDEVIVTNVETTAERDRIQENFSQLLDEYNELETSNDSLNQEINNRKEEIVKLIDEIKNTKNWASSMKKKYEDELATLRSVMKHYVYQIDSLNTINQQLTAENGMIKNENERYRTENDELNERNTELVTTIEEASVISASHISVVFLNQRDKETAKSGKIDKLKVNFSLSANKLASSGQKTVYLRIKKPDGYVISTGTFTAGDQQLAYTDKR
ncbi:MAG: hypothetical protein HUK15_07570, partial [Bacteroidales bacterium]|nr:hypothetical protein [Bacteroidales bacterium]